jgi:hypothetical protein
MRRTRLLLFAFMQFAVSGCAMTNWLFPPAPFSNRAPCRLPPGASKTQIVQRLNENIHGTVDAAGLASWRSSHVKIRMSGLNVPLNAQLAVAAPRNFRLRVAMPVAGSELADMGSNSEHFWFWAKDAPHRNVITVSHQDLSMTQQHLSIPFNPDWLMSVFGVVPLDESEFELRRAQPNSRVVELDTGVTSPHSLAARRVVRVDACHGIILEHAVYDARGVLVASATLADHHLEGESGLIMPRVIRLRWPETQQELTLQMDAVELNPSQLPGSLWMMPEKGDYPRLDLGQVVRASLATHEPLDGQFDSLSPLGLPSAAARFQQHAPASAAAEPLHRPPPHFRPPPSADVPPPAYSPEAERSSSVRPPRARGLWRWPRD